ncbi:MAG: PrsW family intramembrane metalloprotease [Chloroflexota bacterium]|mgnify:CR=1 FL=1|nr:MAG: PrsW family intramembrane metalloprotease [Chloroflexota bacterium]
MPYRAQLVARALVGSPLRSPVYGCLFCVGMLLLIGLAFLGHLTLWILEPLQASATFLLAAMLGAVASLPVMGLLWYLDRRERESLWLFIGAALWGAAISTGVSALLNALGFGFIALGLEVAGDMDTETVGQVLTAALVAPPVEEMAKGIALLVLFWFLRAEFDNVRDGIIYGALVGLGFNVAEYALYVMQGYLESGRAPFGEQFAGRFVFLGFNGHMLWSALCGAGVGLARQTRSGCLRIGAPVGGYTVATLAHALNNSLGIFALAFLLTLFGYDIEAGLETIPVGGLWAAAALMNVLVQGFPYILLFTMLWLSSRWERDVIRTYLADEVGISVTPEEYARIARDRLFGDTRWFRGREARIANAQNELAFRKWHVAREGGDPNTDPLVAAWREDIAALREE